MKGSRHPHATNRGLRCDSRGLRDSVRTSLLRRPTHWRTSKRCCSGVRDLKIPRCSTEVADLPVLFLREIQRFARQVAVALVCRDRLGEQESLPQAATELADLLELLPALDAFGDHFDIEMARH